MSPRSAPSPVNRTDSMSPYPSAMSRKAPMQPKSTRQQYSACGACRMRRVKCDLKDLPTLASGLHPPCSNCSERRLNCVDEFAEVKAVKLLRRGRRLQKVEQVYGKTISGETDLHSVNPPRCVIPQLKPEFFRSPFFHRFHIQRPILEPNEYCNRYSEWFNGGDSLEIPGQLIALVLVVWAASYGINEAGEEAPESSGEDNQQRKERVNEMLVELLYLIDIHGILRKPSWDSARVLLLTMPLTEEVQNPMERLAMYDSTMSQIYALSTITSDSGCGDYVDALVRARVFWYAYVVDGVTSGLRGGRISLGNDDLAAFEATLPPIGNGNGLSADYAYAYRFATVPIRIAVSCRDIHAMLTGPKARLREDIDEDKLHIVWDALDRCWKDLDSLRSGGTHGIVQAEDVERFIDGWQIFLFESHNVIRESLKGRLVPQPGQDTAYMSESGRRKSDTIMRLHVNANSRCHTAVRHVVSILRRNLGTPFFQFDAALVRDGCFFAGFLLAGDAGTREEVEICLRALSEMRWAFSKNDEREHTLGLVWEGRPQGRGQSSRSFSSSSAEEDIRGPGIYEGNYVRRSLMRPTSVPPLSLSATTMGAGYDPSSAPNTACTADGRWPSAASGSGSESEQYQGSSHRSSPSVPHASSSYPSASHNPLSINNVLRDDVNVGPPPLLLASSRVPASHPTGQGSYYVPPYNYLPVGDTVDARQAPAASGTMEALHTTDQAPTYSHPTTSFDYTGVSYSSTSLGQSEAGPSYLPATSTTQGGSPPFGSGGYY